MIGARRWVELPWRRCFCRPLTPLLGRFAGKEEQPNQPLTAVTNRWVPVTGVILWASRGRCHTGAMLMDLFRHMFKYMPSLPYLLFLLGVLFMTTLYLGMLCAAKEYWAERRQRRAKEPEAPAVVEANKLDPFYERVYGRQRGARFDSALAGGSRSNFPTSPFRSWSGPACR